MGATTEFQRATPVRQHRHAGPSKDDCPRLAGAIPDALAVCADRTDVFTSRHVKSGTPTPGRAVGLLKANDIWRSVRDALELLQTGMISPVRGSGAPDHGYSDRRSRVARRVWGPVSNVSMLSPCIGSRPLQRGYASVWCVDIPYHHPMWSLTQSYESPADMPALIPFGVKPVLPPLEGGGGEAACVAFGDGAGDGEGACSAAGEFTAPAAAVDVLVAAAV